MRPRCTNWQKDRRRRSRAFPDRVNRANAEYDKVHGPARVIEQAVQPYYQSRWIGTLAPFPYRPEHRLMPPWVAPAGDPPLRHEAPRYALIAIAQRCFCFPEEDRRP